MARYCGWRGPSRTESWSASCFIAAYCERSSDITDEASSSGKPPPSTASTLIDRVDCGARVELDRAGAGDRKLLVELDQLVVGDQLALRIDEIVLGPVFLDLALGLVEAGAQLVEPRLQLVGGAAGRVGLQLADRPEEDLDQRVGDQRGFLGLFGRRADRSPRRSCRRARHAGFRRDCRRPAHGGGRRVAAGRCRSTAARAGWRRSCRCRPAAGR